MMSHVVDQWLAGRGEQSLRAFAGIMLVCGGLAGCASGDPSSGIDTGASLDVPPTLGELAAQAKAGDPRAQRSLGLAYLAGEDVAIDEEAGLYWLTLGAEGGDGRAMREIGDLYRDGRLVERDRDTAISWYRQAADAGDSIAERRLGRALLRDGDDETVEEAVDLLLASARNGDTMAQIALAEAHDEGGMAAPDPAYADYWYSVASNQLEREAHAGDARSAEKLGDFHLEGKGTEVSGEAAVRYYEMAAESGRERSVRQLAKIFDRGLAGVPRDPQRAAGYYATAAAAGDVDSHYKLGRLFYEGDGVPRNGQRAEVLLSVASERGNEYASYYLGELYADPGVAPTDLDRAASAFERSALAGYAKAYFRLGELAEARAELQPEGSPEARFDRVRARMWYLLAGEQGYERGFRYAERLEADLDAAARIESASLVELYRIDNELR